jgi:hypothetical protein
LRRRSAGSWPRCRWKIRRPAVEGLAVARCLGGLQCSEGQRRLVAVHGSGDREILPVVSGDLDEAAASGISLVELPRRVKVAGAETGRGRTARQTLGRPAEILQGGPDLRLTGEKGLEGRVSARYGLHEKRPEIHGRPVFPPSSGITGRLAEYPPRPDGILQEPAGSLLGRLHIGLVEGVHPQPPAGAGRGRFPKVQEGSQVPPGIRIERNPGGPAALGHTEPVRGRPGFPGVQEGEDSVFTGHGMPVREPAGDGQDSFPFLAGALRQELLQPVRERGQFRGMEQDQLVPSHRRRLAQENPQLQPPGGARLRFPPLPLRGLGGVLPQPAGRASRQGGGHEAEQGQGGKAAADVRVIQEDSPEAEDLGERGQAAARVGDRDEMAAGPLRSEPVCGAAIEMFQQGQGLDGPSRLGGGDEKGLLRRETIREGSDRHRVRRVEDLQGQTPLRAQEPGEHVRGEAGPSHAQEENPPEAFRPHGFCKGLHLRKVRDHGLRTVQPAQAMADFLGRPRPEGRVLPPEARPHGGAPGLFQGGPVSLFQGAGVNRSFTLGIPCCGRWFKLPNGRGHYHTESQNESIHLFPGSCASSRFLAMLSLTKIVPPGYARTQVNCRRA